jgi:hypothetical protein
MSHIAASWLTYCANHAGVQLRPGEKRWLEHRTDEVRSLYDHSSSGRTTALGRKVERPGCGHEAGPSGQRDQTRHDRKHTNR